MGSAQTEATKRYTKKVGLIAKSYKIKKSLADEFAEACATAGISQSAQISKMMQDFIDSAKDSKN